MMLRSVQIIVRLLGGISWQKQWLGCVLATLVLLPLSGITAELVKAPVATSDLAEVLRQAEENDAAKSTLALRQQAASLNRENTAAARWPSLDLAVDYELGNQMRDEYEYGRIRPYFSLSQELFGRIDTLYEQQWSALTKSYEAEVGVYKNKRDLLGSTAKGFYTLLLATQQRQRAERTVARTLLDLQAAQAKNRDGLLSDIDLLQVEAAFGGAEGGMLEAQQQEEQAALSLANLLGPVPAKSPKTIDRNDIVVYTVEAAQVITFAEKHNKELALAGEVVEQLPRFQSMVNKVNWPTVSMSAFIGEGGNWNNSDEEDDFGIRLTVKQNIFDNGVLSRKGTIMTLEMRAMQQEFASQRHQYFQNLNMLVNQFHYAGKALGLAKKQTAQGDELARRIRRSYELGLLSYPQMLEQQETVTQQEAARDTAVVNYLMAELQLKLGAGLTDIAGLADHSANWLEIQ